MKTHTIEVTWSEDTGQGRLHAHCQSEHTLSSNVVRWDTPINAGTDSWSVAYAVTEINGAEVIAVDHDKGTVFVHVNGDTL